MVATLSVPSSSTVDELTAARAVSVAPAGAVTSAVGPSDRLDR
jgi:hypothetical protein